MEPERSLRREVAAAISAAILGVMAIAMVCAVLLLKRGIEHRIDARLVAAATQLQGAVSRAPGGGIAMEDGPEDSAFAERSSGWGWVVRDGQAVIARSRSLASDDGQARLPLGGLNDVQRVPLPDGTWRRSITVRIRGADGLSATVSAPQSAVTGELAADALLALPAIGALALLLVVVAWHQAGRALRPVKTLADDLDRLKGGAQSELPPSRFRELSAVAALVNGLLGERQQALEEAKARAARLAHGLKTPLAILAARFGAHGTTPDPDVIAAVDSMNRLVRLNLAEARAGRASAIAGATTPLAPMIDDLVQAFRHISGRRDIAVSRAFPVDAAVAIPSDDLQEVLGNLLDNAFRHASREIDISGTRDTLVIRNDGAAFPAGLVSHFGAPQGAPARMSQPETAGLGLRIADDILRRHGGSLAIGNDPSATVSIRWPATRDPAAGVSRGR